MQFEFEIHIISCDNFLKELFLLQARQEKKEKELLKWYKRKKKHKKKIKFDVNNSMSEVDYFNSIYNDEDEYEDYDYDDNNALETSI